MQKILGSILPLNSVQKYIYYPFAGLDFLYSHDGKLYLLEANAIPGGVWVITRVAEEAQKILDENEQLYTNRYTRTLDNFIKGAINFHLKIRKRRPQIAIVTVPIVRKDLLNLERTAIANAFRKFGIRSFLASRDELSFKNGIIKVMTPSGNVIKPDIIIRRTGNFFKCVKQVIINSSEIGKITGNKWKTYKILRDVKGPFYLPITFYANSVEKINKYARYLLTRYKSVVLKPYKGSKGKGIHFINNEYDLKRVIDEIKEKEAKTSYVVQEKIEVYPLEKNGEKYAYDLRVLVFMGKIIGIQIRRAPRPIDPADESTLVSNISRGGVFVIAILDKAQKKAITIHDIKGFDIRLSDRIMEVDDIIVHLGKKIMQNIKSASKIIQIALNKAV
ncbi:MAG: YheC/YheD family protein [Candidatus Njordarchaeales archaeon]